MSRVTPGVEFSNALSRFRKRKKNSSSKHLVRRFHVVEVQWTSSKCTKKRDARAKLLFGSQNHLFLTLSSSLWLRKLPIVTAYNTKCQELFVNQLIYDSFKSISEDYPRPTITCPQNNIGTLLFYIFYDIYDEHLRRFREVLPQGKWIRNWQIVVSKKESLFIFQS